MSDWTAGYMADIEYTYGYYPELSPQRAKLAFLQAGIAFPEFGTACELGFGQGVSANIHAAASITRWHGTDFNPAQAAFARDLAAASGTDAQWLDCAFDEFAARADLPEFDFIGMHGIWSWVSDENRHVLVDFIRRKLKVGGVLYVSYNTMPGWSGFAPMRHLMRQHADVMGAPGPGILTRVDNAMEFADKLLATNPIYARVNPVAGERMKALRKQNRNYIAHEYFNRDWYPMHFSEMVDWLSPAKMQFACPAHLLEHVDAVNFTPEQQAFLKDIPDPMFRQTVQDFMVNRQFRRDYWVKGARPLPAQQRDAALREQKVVLIVPRETVSLKVTGPIGEARMNEGVYNPILDLLADHKVRTIGEIEGALQGKGVGFPQIVQAVAVLCGGGQLSPAESEANIAATKARCDRLNAHLMQQAFHSTDIGYLASPVTAGGIPVTSFEQLFLVAMRNGRSGMEEWARFAWDVLKANGRRIVREGKPLETDEENLTAMRQDAKHFAERRLAMLQALQVC
ncbi:class I SAM-dependent methyltransferase [Paracidovorax citrulli]